MIARQKAAAILIVVILIAAGGMAARVFDGFGPHQPQSDTLKLSGNIEAHESVLSFKTVQSRIVQLPFNEGQWVTKGTTLAVLDDADYRQQIAIAESNRTVQQRQFETARQNLAAADKTVVADEAQLAQRRLDYQRALDLSRKGFVSAAALDQSKTALQVAEAALERDRALRGVAERNVGVAQAGVQSSEESARLAHIVRDYSVLAAPFDGVITVRQAELGEMVVPGTPVLTIADLDHIWLRAYLNETDLGKVRLGQIVTVKTDSYPNKQYRGRLSFIASKAEFTPKSVETNAERVALVYRVKIDIDNRAHELVPGMPADAYLALNGSARGAP
jgi:HlyD family secretion protein